MGVIGDPLLELQGGQCIWQHGQNIRHDFFIIIAGLVDKRLFANHFVKDTTNRPHVGFKVIIWIG